MEQNSGLRNNTFVHFLNKKKNSLNILSPLLRQRRNSTLITSGASPIPFIRQFKILRSGKTKEGSKFPGCNSRQLQCYITFFPCSGAGDFHHLPKTASWRELPAILALLSLANLKASDHRPGHTLRLLCLKSSLQRHLAITSHPNLSLCGTLGWSRVHFPDFQTLSTPICTVLSLQGLRLCLFFL